MLKGGKNEAKRGQKGGKQEAKWVKRGQKRRQKGGRRPWEKFYNLIDLAVKL